MISDNVNRKFLDVIDVDEWEIETDEGWVDIVDVKKTIQYEKWILRVDNGLFIKCADNHIVFDEFFNEIFVKDCIPYSTKIQTKYGLSLVISVENSNEFVEMYDLGLNSETHRYYSNDILSHNTVAAIAYVLHFILFNEHKTVAILANRGITARGILDKVRSSYRLLPLFLQSGVKEWGKSKIALENGCKVIADATSGGAGRSEAISLLILDEFAFVENNVAEEFMKAVYPTISSGSDSKIFIFSCVTKDTVVYTHNGIQRIGDFIDPSVERGGYIVNDYEVLGMDKLRKGSLFYSNGVAPVYKVHTTSADIKCTDTHKFWAYKDNEYKFAPLSDLKVGDHIAVRCNMQQWGTGTTLPLLDEDGIEFDRASVDKNLMYLLGVYAGNGRLENGNLVLKSEHDLSTMLNIRRISFLKKRTTYYLQSENFIKFLKLLGFDINIKGQNKVHDDFLKLEKNLIFQFVKGLMDTKAKVSKGESTIEVICEGEITNQLRYIFLNMGMFTQKRKYEENKNVIIKLISGNEYYNQIGFNNKWKQKLKPYFRYKSRGSFIDIIPGARDIINTFPQEVIDKYKIFLGWNGNILRTKLLDIGIDKEFPHGIVDKDMKWTPIKSITYLGEEETYDFSLPDDDSDKFCHSVLYNGIVGHQTPCGMNHFYKLWNDAKEKRNKYVTNEIKWDDVPGRGEKFKKETIANIGIDAWNQEYLCSFLGSSGSLISPEALTKIVYKVPMYETNGLIVYKKPEEGHTYIMTVDPSEGLGLDYSAFIVSDVSQIPYDQVACYRSNLIDPHVFPDIINDVAKRYNGAFVLVESNSIGMVVIDILHNTLEYDNLVMTVAKGKDGLTVSGGYGFGCKLGIKTTKTTKRVGCSVCKTLIESEQYTVNDYDTLKELTTFVRHNQTYQAEEGYNDDTVMCLVLFSWLSNQQYFKDLIENSDIKKKLSDKLDLHSMTENLTPFGIIENGIPDIIDNNESFTPEFLRNGAVWSWGR